MKQRVSFVILAATGIAAATLSFAALLGVIVTHPLVINTTLNTTAVNYNATTQLFG